MKTDLGECNLPVSRADGECSEILVSNPDDDVMMMMQFVPNKLSEFTVLKHSMGNR